MKVLFFCFVAALHFGCTRRRASRNQRSIKPRCYLCQDSTNFDNTFSPQYQVFMKPNNFAPKNLPVMTFHNDVLSSPQEKCPVSKYLSYPLCYSLQVRCFSISNNVTDSYKSKYSRPVSVEDATNGIIFGGCDDRSKLLVQGSFSTQSSLRTCSQSEVGLS